MAATTFTVVEEGFDTIKCCWAVRLRTDDGYFACSIADSLADDRIKELQWYLEEFATEAGSPFETDRAEKCRSSLRDHAQNLAGALDFESRIRSEDACISLQVQGISEQSTIFRLLWELLEQVEWWRTKKSNFSPILRVVVSRSFGLRAPSLDPLSMKILPMKCPSLNILFITSRPRFERDVGHRLVSERLFKVVKRAQESLYSVHMHIVRPGTWTAVVSYLKRTTERFGQGFFHIVHLDVHGRTIVKDGLER